jgi:hypothetical protein
MYNIPVVNDSVPSYLTDILPPRISKTTNYPLRNSELDGKKLEFVRVNL